MNRSFFIIGDGKVKKIRIRIITYMLVFLMTFTTVFSVYVQSAYAATEIGLIIDVLGLLFANDGRLCTEEVVENFYNQYKPQIDLLPFVLNADKTVTLSEETVNQIRELFDEYLSENPDLQEVAWMPVVSSQ